MREDKMPTLSSAKTDSIGQRDRRSERRLGERIPLAARIEILEKSTNTAITGHVSNLSIGGCYADVLNTFAEGTQVQVRIEHDLKSIELEGDVRFTQPGFGMGISFHGATPQQLEIMMHWLALQNGGSAEFANPRPQEHAKAESAALPNDILSALIEMLARRNILSGEEKEELLGRL
jgi:hypothetical protein